ncbi:MAG: hypothetical protein WDW38_010908 [Sanguina aurantia]
MLVSHTVVHETVQEEEMEREEEGFGVYHTAWDGAQRQSGFEFADSDLVPRGSTAPAACVPATAAAAVQDRQVTTTRQAMVAASVAAVTPTANVQRNPTTAAMTVKPQAPCATPNHLQSNQSQTASQSNRAVSPGPTHSLLRVVAPTRAGQMLTRQDPQLSVQKEGKKRAAAAYDFTDSGDDDDDDGPKVGSLRVGALPPPKLRRSTRILSQKGGDCRTPNDKENSQPAQRIAPTPSLSALVKPLPAAAPSRPSLQPSQPPSPLAHHPSPAGNICSLFDDRAALTRKAGPTVRLATAEWRHGQQGQDSSGQGMQHGLPAAAAATAPAPAGAAAGATFITQLPPPVLALPQLRPAAPPVSSVPGKAHTGVTTAAPVLCSSQQRAHPTPHAPASARVAPRKITPLPPQSQSLAAKPQQPGRMFGTQPVQLQHHSASSKHGQTGQVGPVQQSSVVLGKVVRGTEAGGGSEQGVAAVSCPGPQQEKHRGLGQGGALQEGEEAMARAVAQRMKRHRQRNRNTSQQHSQQQ